MTQLIDPSMPHVHGMHHELVEIPGGIRLHVASAGDGVPAVLLHGFPQHWYEWRRVIPGLVDGGYRVVCIDLRGCGWSDSTTALDDYRKDRLAADVAAVCDALQLGPAHLIGHDWGGWVGFWLATSRPDLVRTYLALGIIHPWCRPGVRLLRDLWRFAYQPVLAAPVLGPRMVGTPAIIRHMLRAGAASDDTFDDADLRAFADRFADPERANAGSLLYRSFLTRELRGAASEPPVRAALRAPTLLLTGARDPVIRPRLLDHRDAPETLDHEVVPCGHFIPEELPELVVQRARSLFERA